MKPTIGYRILVALLVSLIFTSSFIVHMPVEIQEKVFGRTIIEEPLYSDVTIDMYKSLFLSDSICRAYSSSSESTGIGFYPDSAKKFCVGEDFFPLPLRDYRFPYPPLTIGLWFISTYLAYSIASARHSIGVNPLATIDAYMIFYFMYSFLIFLAVMVSAQIVVSLLKNVCRENSRKYLVLPIGIATPSMLVYLLHGYDIYAQLLTVLGLYMFSKKRYGLSSLMFGLASCISPYVLVLIIPLLFFLYRKSAFDSLLYSLLGFLGGLTPYLILYILSPSSVTKLVNTILLGYCNSCIYLFILNNIWSYYGRAFSVAAITFFTLLLMSLKSRRSLEGEISRFILLLAFTILFSYSFPPQVFLLVLPLLVIFSSNNTRILFSILLADALNALIIPLWFKDYEIRQILIKYINIPLKYSPWTPDSPIQWIAQLRNIILFIVLLAITTEYLMLGDYRE